MENNVPQNGPIDLDALDDYLMSDLAPDESMGLSDLDGFLTGIVIGPEYILLSRAQAAVSRKVCIGVLPKHQRP
jgi:hypothetical protein